MEKDTDSSQQFLWVGNDAAVDFVNTEIALDGNGVDMLVTPKDYLDWLKEAGIELRAGAAGRKSAMQGLRLAKEFRSKVRQALKQVAKRAPLARPGLATVNEYLSRTSKAGALKSRESKFALSVYWKAVEAADYVAPIAWAFATFLATANLDRVRKCKNPDCVLFFCDTSKSGTRTWCSLDLCGNKMRMAASRKRHQI